MTEIIDQVESVLKDSNLKLMTPTSIPVRDLAPVNQLAARTTQQTVQPTAINQRLLGQILTSNPASSALGTGGATAPFTILDTKSATVNITLSDNYHRTIFAIPDIALYVGSVASANLWPNATYNMSNLTLSTFNSWAQTDNVNIVTSVPIWNHTGSDLTLILVYRWRIITNPTGGASGTNQ